MSMILPPVVWLLGMMLAPHSLALLGNLAGELQWLLPAVLAAGVGLYWLNIVSLRSLTQTASEPVHELNALADQLGHIPAVVLYFTGRLITTLAAPTVLLVTAGFVFNETFVHWFPNFAFAFILLGLVMAIHLLGEPAARQFQLVLIAVVVAGIFVLILMALAGSPVAVSQDEAAMATIRPHTLFAALMLFVGFDLAANHAAGKGLADARTVISGLLIAGLIFIAWSLVSIWYVQADKLADSYIAHTLTARAIGGQTGRLIMGVVLITGACAAVNALFWNLGHGFRQITAQWPAWRSGLDWFKRPVTATLVAGIVVAAMMAEGIAGTDEIDTYVRAGLYFWMLHYAGVHLAVALRRPRQHPSLSSTGILICALIGFALMTGSIAVLIASDPQKGLVLKTGWVTAVSIALFSMVTRLWRRKFIVKGNEY